MISYNQINLSCAERMVEKNNIKVESYQQVASVGGWSGGSRTLWAISTVGAIAGAFVGLLAPFIPVIFAGAPMIGLPVIGASMAAFAATGLSMGFGSGLMLGRISGATAAVAEESERRSKEWTIRQMKGMNPDVQIVPDPPKPAVEKKSFGELFRTYFNPRVGLVMTVGVYGLVAGIVKIDDLGLALRGRSSAAMKKLGTGLVRLAPWLMKFLSVAGTIAMFLVGGGLLVHHVASLHHFVEALGLHALLETGVEALVGVLVGAVVLGAVAGVRRVLPSRATH